MPNLYQAQWQRNQMTEALWRYAVTAPHWGSDPNRLADQVPKVFQSRVKKMLNLDRIPGMTPWDGLDETWAFYEEPGQGVGREELFSTFHVFMMSLAIELLNIGIKQSEAIFFLKHMKPTLLKQFRGIQKTIDTAPVSGSNRSPQSIQRFVWMVVRRLESQEAHPGFMKKIGEKRVPLFMEPEFFEGFDAVAERFAKQLSVHRHAILIEIADPALALPGYLSQAPVVRRGRSVADTSL